jgi:N-hydroxyarylamine O-acetyltransferase
MDATALAYLDRLGLSSVPSPSLDLLAELQAAHLVEVPFENLDVYHGRGASTDVGESLDKIVRRGRGGWCFQVNGAFGWLLDRVGFDVVYVSCRVHDDDGWGPANDHCALVVHIDRTRYFVDVGFGDCCMLPIPLVDGDHAGVPRAVRCAAEGNDVVISECSLAGVWEPQLRVALVPVEMSAFDDRSTYLQTEPGLSWSTKAFATRATDVDGSRITLRDGLLRRRSGAGGFVDEEVGLGDWSRLLEENFGIVDTH